VHELVSAICHARGESWFLGLSLYNLGLGLWRRGETDAATARLREGLRCLRGVGDTFLSARCLDALAWIRYDTDPPERVATLMGITTRLAHTMGTRLSQFAGGEAVRERAAGRARAALGERAYQAAFARGEALSLDEAVARALDEPPAPAPPAEDAPAPLTRREEQVAALIAQGRSNREIAAALVISQRTAESHVEHILDKLGFGSRAQVAAWMAARHPFGVSTETAGSDMVR
jgi:non-specific serine/threonine protein kinase